MAVRWKGLIAPTEVPTGDGRMFAAGKLTSRPMPIPLMVRFGSGGHDGATVVGKINRIYDGPGGYWGEGEFLDPTMVPEVPKSIYMLQQKVMGPSVDLDRDFTVEAIKHPTRPDRKAALFKEYNVIGATLVPMPAFHQVHMSVDNSEDKVLLASVMPDLDFDGWEPFAVNGDSWKNWPLAPRDYKFDADDAVKRIAYWAGIGSENPSLDRYASAFLWRNGNQAGDTLAQDSFRLPLCDIVNGEPHLIYHAAYAAAALLSGAHGGLPNIPDDDKQAMIPVINEIYAACAQAFNDPHLTSPFLQNPNTQHQMAAEDCGCSEFAETPLPPDVAKSVDEEKNAYGADGKHTFVDGICSECGYGIQGGPVSSVNIYVGDGTPGTYTTSTTEDATVVFDTQQPYGNVKYADPGYRDSTKRYPIDNAEHVRAAWSYINQEKNAAFYNAKQLKHIKDAIKTAAKKFGIEITDSQGEMAVDAEVLEDNDPGTLLASVAPLEPPAAWFASPGLSAPTPLTIEEDGHIYGHLAQWKVCHVGIGKSCVMAPKSRTNYSLFRVGRVKTNDGKLVDIGKITLGTGHADAHWGIMPSREHYDNTGWAAAIVNVGEDRHGIWVNGSLTTTMTPERIAELRAASLSGDWREVNGNLELIAALAVNNPGFPIYRERGGHAFSLMAVGVIGQEGDEFMEEHEVSGEFSAEETELAIPTGLDPDAEIDPEMAARLERWDAIEEELEEHRRERRMAQLAAIDEERMALADKSEQQAQAAPAGAMSPTAADDAVFIQYNARFMALQEAE